MEENPIITSMRNPHVVNARKLLQRKHRERQGRFLVEGGQLLWMALDGGYLIDEVYTSGTTERKNSTGVLLAKLEQNGVRLIQITPSILASLSTRVGGDPLIGVVQQRSLSLREISVPESSLVLVLDRLQDCGNVGTLVRTADAVGAAAVILLEPCADVTDPRAVRASMGSLFNLPVISVKEVTRLHAWLQTNGLHLVGADAHQGTLWGRDALQGGAALCVGNEAHGLSSDLNALVDTWVRLPVYGKADSLNVAVAGGVLMYLWRKENDK